MHRILNFASPRDQYTCDAAVVWCYDFRFEAVFGKMLEKIGVFYFDPVRIAGGAKCLVSPESESDRKFVLEQIRLSMKLHATRTVALMIHSDCGAYGGLASFSGDAEKEVRHHTAELQKAAAFLSEQIPELKVKAYFVDFEGVYEVELPAKIQAKDFSKEAAS